MFGNKSPTESRRFKKVPAVELELSKLLDYYGNIKVYACPYCKEKDFISFQYLESHVERKHPPKKNESSRKRKLKRKSEDTEETLGSYDDETRETNTRVVFNGGQRQQFMGPDSDWDSDWEDQVIPVEKCKSLHANSRSRTETALTCASVNMDGATGSQPLNLEQSVVNDTPIPPTPIAETRSLHMGKDLFGAAVDDDDSINDPLTTLPSTSHSELSGVDHQDPNGDDPVIICYIPAKRRAKANAVVKIKMEPGVTSDAAETETTAPASSTQGTPALPRPQEVSISDSGSTGRILRGRLTTQMVSEKSNGSSSNLGEVRRTGSRKSKRASTTETRLSSVPKSNPSTPRVAVGISIRPDEMQMTELPVVHLKPNSNARAKSQTLPIPSIQPSQPSSTNSVKKEGQERSTTPRNRGRPSVKRRRHIASISKCNFCSTALGEPKTPWRDRNRLYPVTCPECEDKFFTFELYVTVTDAFREKIYRCGICRLRHSTLAVGMRHLRVHSKDEPYEPKPTAEYYVVNVINKSGRGTRSPRVKSEPLIKPEEGARKNSAQAVTPASASPINNITTDTSTAPTCGLTATDASSSPSFAASVITQENKLGRNEPAVQHEIARTSSSGVTEPTEIGKTTAVELSMNKCTKEKCFPCLEPNCGKKFRCNKSLTAHSKAHALNIGALWSKKRR